MKRIDGRNAGKKFDKKHVVWVEKKIRKAMRRNKRYDASLPTTKTVSGRVTAPFCRSELNETYSLNRLLFYYRVSLRTNRIISQRQTCTRLFVKVMWHVHTCHYFCQLALLLWCVCVCQDVRVHWRLDRLDLPWFHSSSRY